MEKLPPNKIHFPGYVPIPTPHDPEPTDPNKPYQPQPADSTPRKPIEHPAKK